MEKRELKTGNSQIVIYRTPDGDTSLDVRLDNETVWLTQKQMMDLFKVAGNECFFK